MRLRVAAVLRDGDLERGGPVVRRGMAVQARVEGAGDALGMALGELGPGAFEQLVDGLAPEGEPALEMAALRGRLRMDDGVGADRAAAVGACPEQDRLPERRDDRDV